MWNIKNKSLNIIIHIMRPIYGAFKILPTNPKKIVCISRQENEMSLDYKLLITELKEQRSDLKIVFLSSRDSGKLSKDIKIIYNVLLSMYYLATSKVCILDAYWPVVSLYNHKEELKVIQMWHSIGKIKKSGYQTVGKNGGRTTDIATTLKMHKNYDYVVAGGKEFNKFYQESFQVEEEKIVNIGLPRIDYLLKNQNNIKENIYEKYPEFKNTDKKIVLYAPTFRRGGQKGPKELIDRENFDDYIFIVKCHFNQPFQLKSKQVYYCDDINSLDLLTIADYVITDYSAIALEAAILEKKTLYYLYDYNQYIKENGLNIDPKQYVPQYSFASIDDVFHVIDENLYDLNVLVNYREKFLPKKLGESSKELVKLILKLL